MIVFWLICGFMSLLAIAIICWPIIWRGKQKVSGRYLVLIIALVLVIGAWFLYLKLGASSTLEQYELTQEHAAEINAEIKRLGSLENIIAQLQQRVNNHPDARGWFLLGRLYLKAQEFTQAINAFAQANRLSPQDPEILVSYAEALYLAHNNSLDPQAKQLLAQTLASNPQQADALNLLALDAYQHQQYATAIHYWEQLTAQFSADSPAGKNLLQMIAMAQQKLTGPSNAGAKIKLPVAVSIPAAIKQEFSGDETVFIFAQAVQGPPMPLAVVRRTVRDFPLQLTLDDTMSMMPDLSLKNFKQVRIVARISKSNQPLPQPGDWEGSSGIVQLDHIPEQISVVIDHQRK